MKLFNPFRRKLRNQSEPPEHPRVSDGEQSTMSKDDAKLLLSALDKGTPCVPFIPVNELVQSMSGLKPDGMNGYYIARVPTLNEDGTLIYLYKEEFSLLQASKAWSIETTGRTYFFLGLIEPVPMPEGHSDQTRLDPQDFYVTPDAFSLSSSSLVGIDFLDVINFAPSPFCAELDLTYIPTLENFRASRFYAVNFILASRLHPREEIDDPSGWVLSFDRWKELGYPTGGPELAELLARHVQATRQSLL